MKYQFQWLPESGIGWYLTGAEFLDRGLRNALHVIYKEKSK